jgi:hypothetical protein
LKTRGATANFGVNIAIGIPAQKQPFVPRASNVEKNLQDDVDFDKLVRRPDVRLKGPVRTRRQTTQGCPTSLPRH